MSYALSLQRLACAAVFIASPSLAFAHAVAGGRVFPATLGIDDPGVSDELALPTFAYIPMNGDGSLEYDVSIAFAKRITPDLALEIGETYTRLKPGGNGFQNLGLGLKYQAFVNADHEFIMSVGLDSEVGHTGALRVGADPFSTLTPTLYFGKGFGDLPTTLDLLRPFAVTGQLGYSVPTSRFATTTSTDPDSNLASFDTERNPNFVNYGFTVQYSLPYMNANVQAVGGPELLKHLIPLVEGVFTKPIAFTTPGERRTTGTIQPGVIYAAATYQVAVEALIPINAASGRHVGVIAELHFFLDDIFPTSIGKPIFP